MVYAPQGPFHRGPGYQVGYGFKARKKHANVGPIHYRRKGFNQKGDGLGSILRGLGRFLFPIFKSTGKQILKKGARTPVKKILKDAAKKTIKSAGKKVLEAGKELAAESASNLASDIISGKNVKEAFHKQATAIKGKIDDKLSNLQPSDSQEPRKKPSITKKKPSLQTVKKNKTLPSKGVLSKI